MTANAFDEGKKKALSAGMNGHFVKTVVLEHIFTVLVEVMAGQRKGRRTEKEGETEKDSTEKQ